MYAPSDLKFDGSLNTIIAASHGLFKAAHPAICVKIIGTVPCLHVVFNAVSRGSRARGTHLLMDPGPESRHSTLYSLAQRLGHHSRLQRRHVWN
jgi:hypothetical protein